MAKRSLRELNHPFVSCRCRASHCHTYRRCDSPCTGRKSETGWDWEMARASLQGFRCSAERCDRKSLPESFALCRWALDLSTYRRRRISDPESQVLSWPSLGKFAVPARRSCPGCGRPWVHHDRCPPLRHRVAPELAHARLLEPTPT